MTKPFTKTSDVLRWVALLPAMIGVCWALLPLAVDAVPSAVRRSGWLFLFLGLAGSVTVCVGVLIAPSRRRAVALAAAGCLLLLGSAILFDGTADPLTGLLGLVAGLTPGLIGALWITRRDPPVVSNAPRFVLFLRWIGLLPLVWLVFMSIAFLSIEFTRGMPEDVLTGVGIGLAVYIAVRVAPSRRKLVVPACLFLLILISLDLELDFEVLLPTLAGSLPGVLFAWRFARRRESANTDPARNAAILRWIAAVAAAFVLLSYTAFLAYEFEVATHSTSSKYGDLAWLLAAGIGAGLSVLVASVLAPSRRRTALLVLAAPLVVFGWLLAQEEYNKEFQSYAILLAGFLPWIAVAWQKTKLSPRRVMLASGDKSQRYKGTVPYQTNEVDRKTFFGRDRESRSLRSLVLAERLVVFFAKSGMGKTSLINASLVDSLVEDGYFPIVVRLADRERGPLGSLLDGIKAAANQAGVDIFGATDSTLFRFFKTAEFWSASDDLLRPVLIIDQFEELFTLHTPDLRREFIEQLAECVRGQSHVTREVDDTTDNVRLDSEPPDIKIVLSMREDFLADLEELASDIPGILHRRFRLGPLSAGGAREAIVGPARLNDPRFQSRPFDYEEGAVSRMIGFLTQFRQGGRRVSGDEVEPAQLQLVCQYLEELVYNRQSANTESDRTVISEQDVGDEAQLQQVLQGFYDRTVEAIRSPVERRRVRELCERRLISGGGRRLTEDGEEIRNRYKISDERLRALVNARLIRPEPRLGGVFYELSHDTLIEPIRQSGKKRILRERLLAGSIASLLVVGITIWNVSRPPTSLVFKSSPVINKVGDKSSFDVWGGTASEPLEIISSDASVVKITRTSTRGDSPVRTVEVEALGLGHVEIEATRGIYRNSVELDVATHNPDMPLRDQRSAWTEYENRVKGDDHDERLWEGKVDSLDALLRGAPEVKSAILCRIDPSPGGCSDRDQALAEGDNIWYSIQTEPGWEVDVDVVTTVPARPEKKETICIHGDTKVFHWTELTRDAKRGKYVIKTYFPRAYPPDADPSLRSPIFVRSFELNGR